MSKLIKLYGERNTNTNYLSKLIELNLHAKEVDAVPPKIIRSLQDVLPGNELVRDIYFHCTYGKHLGWKHTLVKSQEALNKYRIVDANLMFVTITKNPYSWLLSLYRNPYHQYYTDKPSFEDFLCRPWKTVGRDNIRGDVPNPIALWNMKNRAYLQLDPAKAMNITTERIFEDAEKVIQDISDFFSIERKSENFINYERSTKSKSKDSAYYRNFYLSEKWRTDLSSESIAIINESIDKELMTHFGYNILS